MDERRRKSFSEIVKRNSVLAAGIGLTASTIACNTFGDYLCGANIVGYGILGIVLGTMAYRGWNRFKQSPEYQIKQKQKEQEKKYQGLWCSNEIADKLYQKGLTKSEIAGLNGRYREISRILNNESKK